MNAIKVCNRSIRQHYWRLFHKWDFTGQTNDSS